MVLVSLRTGCPAAVSQTWRPPQQQRRYAILRAAWPSRSQSRTWVDAWRWETRERAGGVASVSAIALGQVGLDRKVQGTAAAGRRVIPAASGTGPGGVCSR